MYINNYDFWLYFWSLVEVKQESLYSVIITSANLLSLCQIYLLSCCEKNSSKVTKLITTCDGLQVQTCIYKKKRNNQSQMLMLTWQSLAWNVKNKKTWHLQNGL